MVVRFGRADRFGGWVELFEAMAGRVADASR